MFQCVSITWTIRQSQGTNTPMALWLLVTCLESVAIAPIPAGTGHFIETVPQEQEANNEN